MTTAYTATSNVERLKVKGWVSSATGLPDEQILDLLNDALRSYLVPFVKRARDEWFVSGGSTLTPNSAGRIRIPNSIAGTVRTVSWNNNGTLFPLDRIEPENALPLLSSGGSTPMGFVLKGYELQIVPSAVGAIPIFVEFMERPATMVQESEAGLIESHASLALTLDEVPLAWQTTAPTEVDLISGDSPYSAVAEEVEVVSLVGSVLTLTGIDATLVENGQWVADVGCSPFPNVPIELHPLLQQEVIVTLYTGQGDKRLAGAQQKQLKMERELMATIAPRAQGNARPIVNKSGPGWANGWWGRW